MTDLNLALETAVQAHADAQNKVARVNARHAAAVAALAEAVAGRAKLVTNAAEGFEVPLKALATANEVIKSAEDAVALWVDAKAGADAGVTLAEPAVNEAKAAIADARFARAARNRINAGAKLARLGIEIGAAFSAWKATADELNAAWNLGRVPASHEIENLRDWRMGAAVIPAEIQAIIVQRQTTVDIDLERRERSTWGQWAIPDAEGDADHKRQEAADAERIGNLQSFENAGRN
jgi:hypothetical protein